MIDRKQLKEEARLAMREAKPSPIWVTLAVMVILAVLTGFSLKLSGRLDTYRAAGEAVAGAVEGEALTEAETEALYERVYDILQGEDTENVGIVASILAVAVELMSMVISVGYTIYTLRVSRRERASFGDVFDAFGVFFRAIWITFLLDMIVSLLTALASMPTVMLAAMTGSLLPVCLFLPLYFLPLLAVYSYRLSVFIMLDHPEYSCIQCLTLSRAAMRGHRWELVRLDLSFIGWLALSIIPFVGLWVEPYVYVTRAKYYDALMPQFEERIKARMAEGRQSPEERPPFTGPAPWSMEEDEHQPSAPPRDNELGYHVPGERDPEEEPEDGRDQEDEE